MLPCDLGKGAMLRTAWGPYINLTLGLLEVEIELDSSEGQNRDNFTRQLLRVPPLERNFGCGKVGKRRVW